MSDHNSVVSIFESNTLAQDAVTQLQRSGADIKMLSRVGKDYHTDGHIVGYYNTGDRVKYWGRQGAFGAAYASILPRARFSARTLNSRDRSRTNHSLSQGGASCWS